MYGQGYYVAIVDGCGNQITSFGGGTQYAEDAAHASGDTGTMALAVRKDTAAALAGTDGDYTPLIVDASGRLHANVGAVPSDPFGANADAASATGSISAKLRFIASTGIPVTGTVTVGSHAVTNAGTFAVQAAGDIAHDAADSGSPVKIGGQARTTNPTAVADADRVNAIFDKLGKQVVVGAIRELKAVQKTTISSSTLETTIVTAAGSGVFADLYGLIIANSSATATEVTIKDATAGTTRFVIAVPAGETRGFMLPVDSAVPQATANNNWTATCADSVAAIEISVLYVKNT